MYAMYKEECEESGEPFASEWVYRNIFNTQFNISFKPPQKDTCKTCDVLKIQIEACNNDDERVKRNKKSTLRNRVKICAFPLYRHM